jgi:hypothetical protein
MIGANYEPADHVAARYLAAMVCPDGTREACGPVIAQTTWNVGYHYHLIYTPGFGYGFTLGGVLGSPWMFGSNFQP